MMGIRRQKSKDLQHIILEKYHLITKGEAKVTMDQQKQSAK